MSHGIYFVSPELYSDGLLVRRGEKVQYSASSGELPRSFNLGGARISAADQRVLLSLIHISEPTRLLSISYAVFCLKKFF